MEGIYQNHCPKQDPKQKDCLCEETLKTHFQLIDSNVVKEHCKLKEAGCKDYCYKYCDHFALPDSLLNADPHFNCPYELSENATEKLLPMDVDIDQFLTNFRDGKDCLQ